MPGDPYIALACLLRGRELRLGDKGGRFIARLGKKGKEGRSWRRTCLTVREPVLDTPMCKSSTLPRPSLPAADLHLLLRS